MSKLAFHQNLIGKRLVENPENDHNERAHFKYFGLQGKAVEIVGAWLDDGCVSVMVRDGEGRNATLYPSLYFIREAQ